MLTPEEFDKMFGRKEGDPAFQTLVNEIKNGYKNGPMQKVARHFKSIDSAGGDVIDLLFAAIIILCEADENKATQLIVQSFIAAKNGHVTNPVTITIDPTHMATMMLLFVALCHAGEVNLRED